MLAGGPAFYGDIQVLSETRPAAQRVHLAAAGRAGAAARLRQRRRPPACPSSSAARPSSSRSAPFFFVAQQTPLSIFVLNLATLLGLGLGVDYALLLTSRFREELAARGGGHADGRSGVDQPAVNEAVAATVATAGRAVFFSGLTVLLGLIGLILFEFMVLRSVGIAGAIVVGLAVAAALTLLPAVLAVARPARRLASPSGRLQAGAATARRGRRLGAARPTRDGPAAALLHPDAAVPAGPRLAVPARALQRARRDRSCRPACPSRQAYDLLVSDVRRGRVRAAVAGHPDGRPGHRPAERRPRCTTTRAASRPIRASAASRASSTSIRASTLPQYQLLYARARRPGRPLRRRAPAPATPRTT